MNIYSEERDGITMIAVEGDIDGSTSGELQDNILASMQPTCRILIDVSRVNYMSSSGLRVLLLLHRKMTELNGASVLVGVSQDIQDAMAATGFLKHFTIVETFEDGLQVLAG